MSMRILILVLSAVIVSCSSESARAEQAADERRSRDAWYAATSFFDFPEARDDVSRGGIQAIRTELETVFKEGSISSSVRHKAWEIQEVLGRLAFYAGEFSLAARDFEAALASIGRDADAQNRRRLENRLALALALDGRFTESEGVFSRLEPCSGGECDLREAYTGCGGLGYSLDNLDLDRFVTESIPLGACASRRLVAASESAMAQSRSDLVEPLLYAADFVARPIPIEEPRDAGLARLDAADALVDLLLLQRRGNDAAALMVDLASDPNVLDAGPDKVRKLNRRIAASRSDQVSSRFRIATSREDTADELKDIQSLLFKLAGFGGSFGPASSRNSMGYFRRAAQTSAALSDFEAALDYGYQAILGTVSFTTPGLPLRVDMGPTPPDCPPGNAELPRCNAWYDEIVELYASEELSAVLSEYAVYLSLAGRPGDALDTEDRAQVIFRNWLRRNWSSMRVLSSGLLSRSDLDSERLYQLRPLVTGQPDRAKRAFALGFEIIQNVQFSRVDAALRQSVARQSLEDDATRLLIQQRQVLSQQSDTSVDLSEARRGEIRRRIAEIDSRLTVPFSEIERKAGFLPLDADSASSLLAPDEALMVIASLPDRTEVVVVSRTERIWYASDISAADLSKKVAALRAHVDGDVPYNADVAYEVYSSVFRPAESAIGKKRLLVAVSGPLSALPLSMLVTERPVGNTYRAKLKNARWLAQRHAVLYLPSVAALSSLRRDKEGSRHTSFIGFGDPILDTIEPPQVEVRRETGLARLQFAASEIRRLAAVMKAPESQVYLGADATKQKFVELDLSSVSVIAFATHALKAAGPTRPEPGLIFSRTAGADDTFLAASEVASLRIGADLVILSACNTAGEDGSGGEALSGLTQSFLFAGARSVVATHWSVLDKAAADIMPTVLEPNIAVLPSMIADQLQRAVLDHLAAAESETELEPRYWGAFVVVGG